MNQNNNDEADNEEVSTLKEQIYNEDNFISQEEESFEEENNNNDFKYNISTLSIETVNNIFSCDNINKEDLNKQLFEYFDSFG